MSDNAADADAGPGRHAKRTPAIDLDRMTVQELTALIGTAETKLRDKKKEATAGMLARWKAEAADSGLSVEAVISGARSGQGKKGSADNGGTLPVKYKGPRGEEWSGRGRLPKWLQAAESEGKKRGDFAVE